MSGRLMRSVRGALGGAALRAGPHLVTLLGGSWRVRHVGKQNADAARRGNGPVLYAFSHGVLLPLVYTHRKRNIHILVSVSRDGEIIARVTEALGFSTVRGSTSRGGERAILALAARARAGHDVGVTPDGPRGPRGTVAPGALLAAGRADIPIVPLGVASSPEWRAPSWDRFLVPPPFARVFVVYGRALSIPPAPGPAEREALGTALVEVENEAIDYATGRRAPETWARVPA